MYIYIYMYSLIYGLPASRRAAAAGPRSPAQKMKGQSSKHNRLVNINIFT